jgi:ribosomal protein L4
VAPKGHRPRARRHDVEPHKVNKKMDRAGSTSILSQLARDGRVAVVDGLSVDSPKTKALAQKLKAMGLESVLIITDAVDENLYLASRNLKNVMIVEPRCPRSKLRSSCSSRSRSTRCRS